MTLACPASAWLDARAVAVRNSNELSHHVDDSVGAHRIVRCLAVTSTCEIDHAVTFGPFGFERDVVLKRILAGLDEDEITRAARRLLREAAALARLSHPAIVRLYELTEHAGLPVLVLEHVDGMSLAQLLDELESHGAPLDHACALYIGYRIFSALAAAHRVCDSGSGAPAAIVHGDVAPSNVLVPWDGHVKLADFDLSRGNAPGTPGFSAPERLRGSVASTRSDVFSACLLLRELLVRAGGARPTEPPLSRPPLSGAPLSGALLSEAGVGLHPALVDVLEHGLSLDPRGRTVSAAEIAARLREVVDVESARMRLSWHMSAFVHRPTARERLAMRVPRRAHAPDVASSAAAHDMDASHDMDVEVDVDLDTDAGSMGRAGSEPAQPLSSVRPTAVSVRPGALDGDRSSLSALRTIKTARRQRQQAIRIMAALAGVSLAAVCALLVFSTPGGRRLLAGGTLRGAAPAAPSTLAVPEERAIVPVIAIPAAAPTDPGELAESLTSDAAPPTEGISDAHTAGSASGARTTGRILTESSTVEPRVFVDGKPAGQGGTPIVVGCGQHLVQLGGSGSSKTVDVPCGGDVTVTR